MSPIWPRPAVSAAIFRDQSVLMIERAKPPLAGLWSLPGGKIEPGEPAREAALREIMEETGVAARLTGLCETLDIINKDGDVLISHFVLSVFHGLWLAHEPLAASDASQARFVPIAEISQFTTTPGLAAIISTAWGQIGGSRSSP